MESVITDDVFVMPTSFAQQRLWLLEQLTGGEAVYHMPAAIRLTGQLDYQALKRSVNEIVRRHEVLRTAFASMEGIPVQVIKPHLDIPLTQIDLQNLPAEQRAERVTQLLQDEAERAFDLSDGPLMRTTLVRLDQDEHILQITMHHMISDAWSVGILIKEMAMLYDAFVSGKPSPLPDFDLQYGDYAVWQREWLQREVLEDQLAYWREQLRGAPALLELSTDRPRPAVQSYQGAREPLQLDRKLKGKLEDLSRREGVTLFMTLLAAFKVLLQRYTGQEDIVVGTPIANRNRVESRAPDWILCQHLSASHKVER